MCENVSEFVRKMCEKSIECFGKCDIFFEKSTNLQYNVCETDIKFEQHTDLVIYMLV